MGLYKTFLGNNYLNKVYNSNYMQVKINIHKSVEQCAQDYFQKAKKQRMKLDGAREALLVSKGKLAKEESEAAERLGKAEQEHAEKEAKRAIKKEWFENFRWFYTSDGFFVIGGRDATTNEIVIKKYTDAHDVIFHTDMSGSPFFVVKTEGREVTEETLQEVADATLVFSRAWKLGLQTSAVFWVKPEQVSKEANAGESLPKGAFMIRGKTNYMVPNPNVAIGLITTEGLKMTGRVMCGPTNAVKANCEKYLILGQGRDKPSAIAKKVRAKFGGEIDEIIRLMPSGTMEIRK